MTISQIAADVRRLAPDVLSERLARHLGNTVVQLPGCEDEHRLALGMAMVLECWARRAVDGWETVCPVVDDYGKATHRHCYFPDSDHGGDWLLSLHAAFLAAKGATDAT